MSHRAKGFYGRGQAPAGLRDWEVPPTAEFALVEYLNNEVTSLTTMLKESREIFVQPSSPALSIILQLPLTSMLGTIGIINEHLCTFRYPPHLTAWTDQTRDLGERAERHLEISLQMVQDLSLQEEFSHQYCELLPALRKNITLAHDATRKLMTLCSNFMAHEAHEPSDTPSTEWLEGRACGLFEAASYLYQILGEQIMQLPHVEPELAAQLRTLPERVTQLAYKESSVAQLDNYKGDAGAMKYRRVAAS